MFMSVNFSNFYENVISEKGTKMANYGYSFCKDFVRIPVICFLLVSQTNIIGGIIGYQREIQSEVTLQPRKRDRDWGNMV